MSRKNRLLKSRIFFSITISLMLVSIFSITATATTYYSTFTKGTEFFQVRTYDDAAWETTVSTDTNPSDWFGGDANITGAQSKFTTLGWTSATWEVYDFLISFFLTDSSAASVLMILDQSGYNKTEINEKYNNTYSLTSGMRSEWFFVSGAFNESYISAIDIPIILNNPVDYRNILNNYNSLAYEIQSDNFGIYDAIVKAMFQNITVDDFLWQVALNNLAIGTPISAYIQELVDTLGCENASHSGNTLIIERTGEANYTLEMTYGAQGTLISFVVKDPAGTVIYQFISIGNTNLIVYILVGVIIGCFSVLIAFLFYKKRRFNKKYR